MIYNRRLWHVGPRQKSFPIVNISFIAHIFKIATANTVYNKNFENFSSEVVRSHKKKIHKLKKLNLSELKKSESF